MAEEGMATSRNVPRPGRDFKKSAQRYKVHAAPPLAT